ncbi:Glu/Leu/Phe/Val dehydrogenase dimerization domain-containing protein [Chelativorans sp.]|uniref:Glu/Leu/Phe/Val family dehydrogenase n=1 Tax=Chelativorans sp. TaxID=2203393 RepID=UPI002811C78C|nr:Glu/Leu/Phe/Val dehydrogenase dimerization domain-containing protein [Chelativorans sp.]
MLQVQEPRTLRRTAGAGSLAISDITAEAAALPAFANHEWVWCGRDEKRGLTAIVAIHNTTLGPALGGTRIWPHESFEAALTDALRLSRGMTYKSAVAGLPLGGGKAVIIADPKTEKSPALLTAYAEMLASLEGQYITAEDVGMRLADADFLRARTPNVVGTTKGGSGNPSPFTAEGVFLGIKAALRHRHGKESLAGVRVAVQGLGSVGWSLCEKLHGEGAALLVSDIDAARVEKASQTFAAVAIKPEEIIAAEADVFAPCALGSVISRQTIPSLKARIVAGSANNQLASHEDAQLLMERGILYAPDYVINAGGLINVAAELSPDGYWREAVLEKIGKIPETLSDIFMRSQAEGRPTNDIAAEIAMERIQEAAKI